MEHVIELGSESSNQYDSAQSDIDSELDIVSHEESIMSIGNVRLSIRNINVWNLRIALPKAAEMLHQVGN